MTHSLRLFSVAGVLGLVVAVQGHAQSGATASAEVIAPSVRAQANPDSVYINPEVLPQFPGGNKAFAAYLTKSIRYPQQALNRGVSGKVYVNFILSATGKVQDAHVVSGPGRGLNDEALRLVWLMPPWEPARVNGQPVRVACTVPIGFNTGR